MHAAAASPAINSVPSAALTNATPDSSPAAQQHGHGLSKGAIAGIVIGSIAGAVLLMTLATFVILKVNFMQSWALVPTNLHLACDNMSTIVEVEHG